MDFIGISLKSLTSRDFTEIDGKQKPLKPAPNTIHYDTEIRNFALVLRTITMENVGILMEYDAQDSKNYQILLNSEIAALAISLKSPRFHPS